MDTILIFESLKNVFDKYEDKLLVIHDKADNYYLHTPATAKLPNGEFFGAVQIKKNYVAFHLMPVYYHPELLAAIPDVLKKKMQGKSCFNFAKKDTAILTELKKLTKSAFEKYKSLDKVK